jgi:hypothetical protein
MATSRRPIRPPRELQLCCVLHIRCARIHNFVAPAAPCANGPIRISTHPEMLVAFCLPSAHDRSCASAQSIIFVLAKLLSRQVVTIRVFVCRVDDYWEGYKLFCYAFYSHSSQHELEFEHSKLGSLISIVVCFVSGNQCVRFPLQRRWVSSTAITHGLHGFFRYSGQIVWRRHSRGPTPSHHALCTTCMHILPLVEMYCKWELQEDCSDLGALMLRFDSASELQSNALGWSLLHMIREDDSSLPGTHAHHSPVVPVNPFNAIRERLSEMDLAIQELQPQVQPHPLRFM